MSFLNPLYHAVAFLIVHIHDGLAHVFGANSGASWALSIVFLTIAMRLVLFPVFVKQIRNQRAMQTLQPKMKELQAKYKNDKEKLNQEMMALWKENGANPLSGCLPLLLQIPIFISLFHTLREIKPISKCLSPPHGFTPNFTSPSCYPSFPGFPQHVVESAARAKIFGAPISSNFFSSTSFLDALGGSHVATRVLCLLLTVVMGATTFITQRQLMARSGPAANSQMAQQQKILLYVFPLVFLFYGFKFPIGVLLYWLTTNVWSMVQQRFVIRRMEPATAGPSTELPPAGPAPGAKPAPRAQGPAKTPPKAAQPKTPPTTPPAKTPPKTPPKAATAGGDLILPPGGAIPPIPPRASNARRPAGRSKNRKRGRR
jgi:YidC/Oxa1 family membrane protein insertase